VKNFAEKPFICNMAARLDAITASSSTITMQDPECGDTWVLFRVFSIYGRRAEGLSAVIMFLRLPESCSVLLTPPGLQIGPGHFNPELLRTDSARDWCQCGRMRKKKREPKVPAKTTIASINAEMPRPRLAGSVRDDLRYQAVLAAEKPTRSR
jgi:hypothetical protein